MEEIRTAGIVAGVIIGILGVLLNDRGWMLFSKFRKAIRDTSMRITKRISHPISRRYRRWRYKDRIARLQPPSYGEYQQLPDADKQLFRDFKTEEWNKIISDSLRSSMQRFEETKQDWDSEESKRREHIFPAGPLVKTSSNAALVCGNCAFFSATFEDDNGGLQISTINGKCHKDPTTQNVYPFSVCSHHSALQGFRPSGSGFYIFAPLKHQETP